MTKSKKTAYNAITSIVLTLLNGLFSIVVIQKIILRYGSDFNGLNSTVTQFINFLLVVEGGFTLATTVALFSPFEKSNYQEINSIFLASYNSFKRIGKVFFVIGSIFSLVSIYFIKSDLESYIIFFSFFLTTLATSINLSYSSTYKALLQTNQREYNLNLIQIITLIGTQILTLTVINFNLPMLYIRVVSTVGSLIATYIIIKFCKKEYKFIDSNTKPNYDKIKGTKELMLQKITGVFYNSAPVVFISIFIGTTYVSVYIIYNSIFSLVKNLIYAVVNAPRSGFGVLLSEKEKKEVYTIFQEFEFIVINMLCIILSMTSILIIPFMKLYTVNMDDASYINLFLPVIMTITVFFEILHIPSGNIINMAGKFKIGKNIQLIAALLLITTMLILNILIGFEGILISVLITSISLAIMEIYYVHHVFFNESIKKFVLSKLPIVIFTILLIILINKRNIQFSSYLNFISVSVILFILLLLLFFIFNLAVYNRNTKKVLKRIYSGVLGIKNKII